MYTYTLFTALKLIFKETINDKQKSIGQLDDSVWMPYIVQLDVVYSKNQTGVARYIR